MLEDNTRVDGDSSDIQTHVNHHIHENAGLDRRR